MLLRCPLVNVLLATFWHETSARIVSVSVDIADDLGEWIPINRFFGADEPNYATYPYGELTLSEIGSIGPAQTYFRAHNLLTTGPGHPSLKFGSTNAYTEDAAGNPIYNWTVVDGIIDSYLVGGVKPYVEVGFMPEALSSHPQPYFFNFTPSSDYDVIYTGWSYPPSNFEKWGELIYQWASHSVEKYGAEEVQSWYWEIWNEPNIQYWNGTTEQYYRLHDYAIRSIRRALPTARVGGCGVAGGAGGSYLSNFLRHSLSGQNYATHGNQTALDFISFHAKGAPLFKNTSRNTGYIQMNVSTQLEQVDQAFAVISSYEQQSTPIIMSEYDPDGCAACVTAQYGYRNGLLYPSYTVVAFARALDLAIRHGVNLQGALTWAFEYEPPPATPTYEGVDYFDGFRVLTTFGIDKPVLNAHRMFGKMSGRRVRATSSAQVPLNAILANSVRGNVTDVGALASFDQTTDTLSVLIWHYHDDNIHFPDADVEIVIMSPPWPNCANLTHWRIDGQHSNSYAHWLGMGSPRASNITRRQRDELVAAGTLSTLEATSLIPNYENTSWTVSIRLPIRALSLLVLQPPS